MSATLQAIDWQVGDGWQPLIDAWRASATASASKRC